MLHFALDETGIAAAQETSHGRVGACLAHSAEQPDVTVLRQPAIIAG